MTKISKENKAVDNSDMARMGRQEIRADIALLKARNFQDLLAIDHHEDVITYLRNKCEQRKAEIKQLTAKIDVGEDKNRQK